MAEVATSATSEQLLVVIDPVARHTDGESVRIAKDVLSAGAATKVCLPEGPEEFARALTRRGSRRPVVVGDDRALVRAVSLLHRRRELSGCALSVVPVGAALTLAGALGVPTGTVAAARAVLDGVERRVDVLVDDSDGVVLGALRIPALPPAVRPEPAEARPWLRTYQSLFRTLAPARPAPTAMGPAPTRLRVEVDGTTLIDLDQQVENVSVTPNGCGTASVEVRPAADEAPLLARGRRITVSGPDFRYRADAQEAGPVRRRTWTVWEGALGLVLPGK
ncbi:diacylglycerol kinase [Streptomyces sp. NBRC 14336]|uniref:diacylglycerol kinase family protein n=1 Tax=Streptomyces sp. NBRC 14336 TaxID=3030992 RepID=UPI0024A18445|nr:diacylglycerol kinase family protein [Streptomyces sp. NBRC 14336]WBO79390.1 acylglycerol kinase family protein [Streptomyces sp. SBE_14.2]GLW49123.1 diacylglycerol kinase [Streptomyces sp. NBRC 14336]